MLQHFLFLKYGLLILPYTNINRLFNSWERRIKKKTEEFSNDILYAQIEMEMIYSLSLTYTLLFFGISSLFPPPCFFFVNRSTERAQIKINQYYKR
jgi:hypothetical protein